MATTVTRVVSMARGPSGFGILLGPVVIRTPDQRHTILEVTGIAAGSPACDAGVAVGDILVEVNGANVRGSGSDGLASAMSAAVGKVVPWKFLRVTPNAIEEPVRMALVLRAHQDHAASRVQSRWRGNKFRNRQRAERTAPGLATLALRTAVRRCAPEVRIQARWRGFLARQRYWNQLESEAERLAHEMRLVEADLDTNDETRWDGAVETASEDSSDFQDCRNISSPNDVSQPIRGDAPESRFEIEAIPEAHVHSEQTERNADRDEGGDCLGHAGGSGQQQLESAVVTEEIHCTIVEAGSLGIFFGCQGIADITKIKPDSPASRQKDLGPGLVLIAVQGVLVGDRNYRDTLELIKQASRPVSLVFRAPEIEAESSDDYSSAGDVAAAALEATQYCAPTESSKPDGVHDVTHQHLHQQDSNNVHANSPNADQGDATTSVVSQVPRQTDSQLAETQPTSQMESSPVYEHDFDHFQPTADACKSSITNDGGLLSTPQQGADSKSARALEMLKQAIPRIHQLQDAHKYQLSMALEAATDAAEKQVEQASKLATVAAGEVAARVLEQTREAHAKHVHSRVAQAKHECASQHCAAAHIQRRFRIAQQRSTLRMVIRAHQRRVKAVSASSTTSYAMLDSEFKYRQGEHEEMINKVRTEKQEAVAAERAQLGVVLQLADEAAAVREQEAIDKLRRIYSADMQRLLVQAPARLDTPQISSSPSVAEWQAKVDEANRQLNKLAEELKSSQVMCEQVRLTATQQEAEFNMRLEKLHAEESQKADELSEREDVRRLRQEYLAMQDVLEGQRDTDAVKTNNEVMGATSAKEQTALLVMARQALLRNSQKLQDLQSALDVLNRNHTAAAKIQSKYRDHQHQTHRRRLLKAVQQNSCRHNATAQGLRSRVIELTAEVDDCSAELRCMHLASEESQREMKLQAHTVAERSQNNNEMSAREARRVAEIEQGRIRAVWERKVRDAQELVRKAELRVQLTEERAKEQYASAQEEAVKQAVHAALKDAKVKEDAKVSKIRSNFAAQTQQLLEAAADARKLSQEVTICTRDINELQEELTKAQDEIRIKQLECNLAKQDLASAAARADNAEQQLTMAKRDLEVAAAEAHAQVTTSQVGRDGLPPSVEGPSGTSEQDSVRWEALLRENTELRVEKMRSESELERCQEQLKFNNSLCEELQNEASNKDTLLAALHQKLSDLRRRARVPVGTGGSQTSSPDRLLQEEPSALSVPSSRAHGDSSGGRSVVSSRPGLVSVAPRYLNQDQHSHSRVASETPPLARTRAAYVEYGPSKETKIQELESSVEELVSRLQMLSSGKSKHSVRPSRSTLDELRSQLREETWERPVRTDRSWSSEN